MIWIGIDPGLTGAIAVIRGPGVYAADPLPVMVNAMAAAKGRKRTHLDAHTLTTMLEPYAVGAEQAQVILEYTQAGMKGAIANYSLGHSSGILMGVLATWGIAYQLVRPQEWKKEFGLIKKDKDASRTMAQQLFPNVNLNLKKDEGRAEALLIAEWGRRQRSRTTD